MNLAKKKTNTAENKKLQQTNQSTQGARIIFHISAYSKFYRLKNLKSKMELSKQQCMSLSLTAPEYIALGRGVAEVC